MLALGAEVLVVGAGVGERGEEDGDARAGVCADEVVEGRYLILPK